MAADPNQRADRILPAAAASNRPVFYAENGRPRSLSEIYDRFARKMDDDAGPLPAAQPVMMADGAQGSDLPPLPRARARALSADHGAPGRGEVFTKTRPESERLASLVFESMGA